MIFIYSIYIILKLIFVEAFKLLIIFGKTVVLLLEIKILGVILNEKLNYKAHIVQTYQKKINTVLTLKKLRNL